MKELKTQLITAVGLIITAGAALLVTNMEAWFSPDEPVVIEQVIEPSKTVKDTIIITKIIKPVIIEKKKEREIDW